MRWRDEQTSLRMRSFRSNSSDLAHESLDAGVAWETGDLPHRRAERIVLPKRAPAVLGRLLHYALDRIESWMGE